MKIIYLLLLSATLSVHAASHHPQDFLKKIAGQPDEGQQIVQHFCINCHASKPVIPLGAPRIHHAEDWKPRLRQGMKKLLQRTDEGVGFMPPRGGCFECTDKQLLLAILTLCEQKPVKH